MFRLPHAELSPLEASGTPQQLAARKEGESFSDSADEERELNGPPKSTVKLSLSGRKSRVLYTKEDIGDGGPYMFKCLPVSELLVLKESMLGLSMSILKDDGCGTNVDMLNELS